MIPDLENLISSDNSLFLHTVILISLLLGGLGLPIPEDLPVLLAGIVAAKGAVPITTIFLTCYFGVILADLIIYGVGYKLGPRLVTYGTESRFFPAITAERVERVRLALNRHQFLCIFLGRHLFPLRTITFLSAGALRIPFGQFLVADLVAALISVALMMGLGYLLGESLTPETLKQLEKDINIYIIIATILILIVLYWKWKKRKTKQEIEMRILKKL